MQKLVNQKESLITSKTTDTGLSLDPTPYTVPRNVEDLELENKEEENVLPVNQETHFVEQVPQDAPPDPEKIRQEEAATKAQAAFRGYLVSVLLLHQVIY